MGMPAPGWVAETDQPQLMGAPPIEAMIKDGEVAIAGDPAAASREVMRKALKQSPRLRSVIP